MFRVVVFALVLVVALATAGAGSADHGLNGGYYYGSAGYTEPKVNADWMSRLPDRLRLSELSIPGTHDTGSYRPFDLGFSLQTQAVNPSNQLFYGVRAFDIRLANADLIAGSVCNKPKLWIYHSGSCQFIEFSSILDQISRFFSLHPRETILMRIRKERDGQDETEFAEQLLPYLTKYDSHFFKGSVGTATLGSARRKIVVFRDGWDGQLGMRWGSLTKQDTYDLSSVWKMADKWTLIRQHFVKTQMGKTNTLFVNFLSASRGASPFFFASGQTCAALWCGHLGTGYTRGVINTCGPRGDCLSEYEDRTCFLGTCSVYFTGLNTIAMRYINGLPGFTRTGIVFADFPSEKLIRAIVDVNDRYLKYPSAPQARVSLSPSPTSNGWYKVFKVRVDWNWSKGAGGSLVNEAKCPPSSTSSGPGRVTVTAYCTDLAGNVGTAEVLLKFDRKNPTIGARARTEPNAAGWYRGDVSVDYVCFDPGPDASGIPRRGACPADEVLKGEGRSVSSTSRRVSDAAGNMSGSAKVSVQIDRTAPSVSITTPSQGAVYSQGQLLNAAFACSDALSGIASCVGSAAVGAAIDTTSGPHTFTATGTDTAGNSTVVTVQYTVAAALGRR